MHDLDVGTLRAEPRRDLHARAMALGAVAYVVKPFDIDRLMDALLAAVGGKAANPDHVVAPAPEPGVEGLDLA